MRDSKANILLLVVAVSTLARAEFVPREFTARHTSVAPTIDGRVNDAVWSSAEVIDEFFAYQSGGDPAAAETTARILWDDHSLYLAFEMHDADIRPSSVTANQSGRDAELYRGDVIELFIRESRDSPKYFEFEWSPDGDAFDARFDTRKFGPPGTDWNVEMTWAASVNGTVDDISDQDVSWTVEAAIPLSAFDDLDVNSEWTFTVARYDYFNPISDTEQLMMSTPGDAALPNAGLSSGFHTYELYDNLTFVPEPQDAKIDGDFDSDGILDMADINLLTEQVANVEPDLSFDLNDDGNVDGQDRRIWIVDLKQTYFGDANLDGEFTSNDLVTVFQPDQYEDSIANNSTWETGDWNGDGDFTSSDFVVAFADGGYEQGPRVVGAAVPEPRFASTLIAGTVAFLARRRRGNHPRAF
ncbi:sugar-binding protein [Planctomycetota bacterium]